MKSPFTQVKYRVQAIEIIGKQKEFIFLIINYLHISYILHFSLFARFLLFSTLLVHFKSHFLLYLCNIRK